MIELSGDPQWQGLLDPLRVGDEHTREDLATSFLVDLLPIPFPATWRTEIRRAVQAVVGRPQARQATCLDVVAELLEGEEDARAAGRAIETYARGGLARLGFATPERMPPRIAAKQVTSIRIRQLPRPLPGTPKSELSEDERIGQAVLRLMIALAMRILSADRTRHKVVGFEEAWFLLQEPAGQRLIEHLNRWGRSEFATPILVTHLLAEAEQIDNLIGARFIFGQESEAEAIKGLGLLRLDRDDDRLVQRLLSYRKGLAMFRDYEGRVAPIRVDPGPRLLEELATRLRLRRCFALGGREPASLFSSQHRRCVGRSGPSRRGSATREPSGRRRVRVRRPRARAVRARARERRSSRMRASSSARMRSTRWASTAREKRCRGPHSLGGWAVRRPHGQ